MGEWHTTEYNQISSAYAEANQVGATTSTRNYFNNSEPKSMTGSMSEKLGGADGGGTFRYHTARSFGGGYNGGESGSNNNTSTTAYSSILIAQPFLDYSEGSETPGDDEESDPDQDDGAYDDDVDSGLEPDDSDDGDDGTNTNYQTVSASGGNTHNYVVGGRNAVNGVNKGHTHYEKSKGSTVSYEILGDPGQSRRNAGTYYGTRMGGTTYTPANGNGGWNIVSTEGWGGGATNSYTIAPGPAKDAYHKTVYKSSGEIDNDDPSKSSFTLSSSSYMQYLSEKSQGHTTYNKYVVDDYNRRWDRHDNGYSFVAFVDNPTFYGPVTINVPAEDYYYEEAEDGSEQENGPEGTVQKVVLRRSTDECFPDYLPECEDEDDDGEEDSEGLTSDGEGGYEGASGDQDPTNNGGDDDGEEGEEDEEDDDDERWSEFTQGGYIASKNDNYVLTTYEARGFSYGTKTEQGNYYIGSGATYRKTVIDYGQGGEGDYCGNVDVTRQKYSHDGISNWEFNEYGLQQVKSTTKYCIGGRVGVRVMDAHAGGGFSDLVTVEAGSYGTSASMAPLPYDQVVPRGGSESKQIQRPGKEFQDNSGDITYSPMVTRTITYWTTSYDSYTRSSIRNFGVGGLTSRIYDAFDTTQESYFKGPDQVTTGGARFDDVNLTIDIPNKITYTLRGTTQSTALYTGEQAFYGGEGIITTTGKNVSFSPGSTTIHTHKYDGNIANQGITAMGQSQWSHVAHSPFGGDAIGFLSRSVSHPGIIFKTKTNKGQGGAVKSPPQLMFTEQYFKSSLREGRTIWTLDERTDSFWSIPGQFASLISKARFYTKGGTGTVSIPAYGGHFKVNGNTITQVQSVRLTAYPPDTDNTSSFTYSRPVSRTIRTGGGLNNIGTNYYADEARFGDGEFQQRGGFFYGGGFGYDDGGTLNIGYGLMGTLYNDGGETDLGTGLERTLALDSGMYFYSYPSGASSVVVQNRGFEYFSAFVDPYQDYYDIC